MFKRKKHPKDIPPTKEEIKAKGYDGWCMQVYMLQGMTHEEARKGAFFRKVEEGK